MNAGADARHQTGARPVHLTILALPELAMRAINHSSLLCQIVALLAAAGVAGCDSGPARGEVRGKVTFKGQPVAEGTVTFVSLSGGEGSDVKLGADGSFQLQRGLPVGNYVVLVTPLIVMVDTSPGKTPPSPEEKPAPNIPHKYRVQATSPFKAEVKKGPNDYTFDMTR